MNMRNLQCPEFWRARLQLCVFPSWVNHLDNIDGDNMVGCPAVLERKASLDKQAL